MKIIYPPFFFKATKFKINNENLTIFKKDVKKEISLKIINKVTIQPSFTPFFGITNDIVLFMANGEEIVLRNLDDENKKTLLGELQNNKLEIKELPLFASGKKIFLPDILIPKLWGIIILAFAIIILLLLFFRNYGF